MAKRAKTGCHCPAGSRRISTKGRGRGFVCQSNTPKSKPFVKAVGC